MTPREKSSSDVSDITKRVVGRTKGKKELIIDQTKQGYFFIKFSTGGELPTILSGRYTRYELAVHDINKYLAGK